MSSTLLALPTLMAQLAAAGHAVALDLADASAPLLLWPWRVQAIAAARNQPAVRGPDGTARPAAAPDEVQWLLIARGDAASFAALQAARQWLADNPLITVGGSRLQIMPSPLPTAELTQLFIAAGRPMTLSAAYVLQG